MNAGRIQQIGSPREIYERLQTKFVADFVGTTNFVDGTVRSLDAEDGYYLIDTELGVLRGLSVEAVRPGDAVVLSIRPEDVHLSDAPPGGDVNTWHGKVDQKVFIGEAMEWQIRIGQRVLLSKSHPSIRTPIGQPIWAQIHPSQCVAMPATAELKAAA